MFVDVDGDADLDIWYPGSTYLWARNDGATSTSDVIPSDPNFAYAAWSDEAVGTWVQNFDQNAGGGARIMPTSQETFYTSTLGEGSSPYTPVTLGMWLTIPDGQASGLYETDVLLTMVD